MKDLKFGYMVGNGNKSVDRKIKNLIAHVEKSVNTHPWVWERQKKGRRKKLNINPK